MIPLTREELLERGHPVWAEVDLDAIRHNVTVLKGLAGGAEVMGVVKGYAYGHGNPAAANAMVEGGATRLGVARLAEALHLREADVSVPIHLFTETPPEAAPAIAEEDLVASVYTPEFASALSDAAMSQGRQAKVHLKLDTGMHRVGILADDLLDSLATLKRLPGLEIEGVWSHLAVADVPDHPFTRKQLDLFAEMCDKVAGVGLELRYRHIANSAATLILPESHFDLVRCGIATYGLWPGEDLAHSADLRPALALRARIGQVKRVPAGDALSYGLDYQLERTSNVATVAAGYADGYDRRLSGKADVLIGGRRYKVSGAVCMDQFMVDMGDDPLEPPGIATLLGTDGNETVSAEELARLSGTINYEVTTRIPSRVPRIYTTEH